MSKNSVTEESKYSYTQNRELSWLRFNQRVLEEADDTTNPELERLKFVSIFSSNLDEFFMVRVGSLFDLSSVSPHEIDNKTGMTPREQLQKIYSLLPGLMELKKQIFRSVMADLKKHGIEDINFSELKSEEKKYVSKYFRSSILPILSPVIISPHHPAPHLVNKSQYVAVLLRDKKNKSFIGLVPVPDSCPPYLALPSSNLRFIRIENIIQQWSTVLFGTYDVEESCIISVTRNADISFDEEKFDDNDEDFRSRVTKLLKKRDSLSVVRLEISSHLSKEFTDKITKLVSIQAHQVVYDSCPLNMGYVFQLVGDISPEKSSLLLYQPYEPRWPEDLRTDLSIIEQVQEKDRLLFFPFDSIDPFLRLLNEAAEHPDVVSIKITIYRLASTSKIARILSRAAENGKEVLVLMELRARFDEANNVAWSKVLEEAGCQIIYGFDEYKCHSKICLITMRRKNKLSYITQVGTGNYNEKTSAMYTDISVLTSSPAIGEDGAAFFRNMLVNNLNGVYHRLLVAPSGIKTKIIELIDTEIAKGSSGYICIKANSVTERGIIDKLEEASRAGVEVHLIIRGICCIVQGVAVHTEGVHVTSIVGRYLEHARIYCFGRGQDAQLFISSADMMTRNLRHRVEIACPIEDPEIRDQLLWILDCQLRDNEKASFMLSDGVYSRKRSENLPPFSSQSHFMIESPHEEVSIPSTRPHFSARFIQRMRKFLSVRR